MGSQTINAFIDRWSKATASERANSRWALQRSQNAGKNIYRNMQIRFGILVVAFFGIAVSGCTSLGNSSRAKAKIAERTDGISQFAFDTDGNELSLAIVKDLQRHGIRALIIAPNNAAVDSRYLLRVRSTDLDMCVPEGSRQMHFNISVTDRQTGQKALLIKGEFGCCNTIVSEFDKWLKDNSGPRPQPSHLNYL